MPTYPSLTTILPTQYYELEPEYPGAKTEYQDFGADYISFADTPIRRWLLIYNNVTTSEKGTFRTLGTDVKYNSKEGSLLSLTFTPRGESAITVRFDEGGLVCTSKKAHCHDVQVRLIRRP